LEDLGVDARINVTEMGHKNVDEIHSAQDRVQRLALVNAVNAFVGSIIGAEFHDQLSDYCFKEDPASWNWL